VISVILYGRNDAHGYNLHRRAALSLNCIAEVLTDPDDEIVFVDYNTPDELPTFVEALSDTLTERCLGLLRVLRVPAAVHEARFASHTHLPAVEPVARNAAARRANPANRWLLSTNTDMIFLPLAGQSLSEIAGQAADAYYGLPRFELPEWLWEHLPRTDPNRAMAEIERLGPGLRLDEATVSFEWIRFDAPGDFQLLLREDFLAIDGFDEEMLLGWHVDANLSRRIFLRRGAIESLEPYVAAYHCNHNRTPTVYHLDEWVANDMDRFFYSVSKSELPAQHATWGLADETLEEVQVRRFVGSHVADIVLAATADRPVRPGISDSREAKFALEYDSSHVLPFIADSLTVSPPGTTIAYLGANPVLERMLGSLVAGLGLVGPVPMADLEDTKSVVELDKTAGVFVVDLGVDASLFGAPLATEEGSDLALARARLNQVFEAFQRLVVLERTRLERGEHPRRFVLVNSSAVFWSAHVLSRLHCSPTTTHARVRRAIVKLNPDLDDATRAADVRAHRLFCWIARRDVGEGRLTMRLGETVDVADLDDYGGFGDGWSPPDKSAVWTQGARSELSIGLDEPLEHPLSLTLAFDSIGVRRGDALRIGLLANGVRVAERDFSQLGRMDSWQEHLQGAAVSALRRPAARLRRQAAARGIPHAEAALDTARLLVFYGLGLPARLLERVRHLLGRRGDPALTWRVPLPAHVVAGGEIDLTLLVEDPVGWPDDRRGLHLVAFEVRRLQRRSLSRTVTSLR
jgi:hypothetical protein